MARKFVIRVPVADLRKEPKEFPIFDYSHQDLRETQLSLGERVCLLDQKAEWLKVFALEQSDFSEGQWTYCTGWLHASEVEEVYPNNSSDSLGVKAFSSFQSSGQLIREFILRDAMSFLGAPYLWGGCSFPIPGKITSVDCSGLIHLIYRKQGIFIPRNAYPQYLKCRPTPYLQAADPLYLAHGNKVSHVILKVDDHTFLEAPETGKSVRTLTWGHEIWQEGDKIFFYDRPKPFTPYPGTFIF